MSITSVTGNVADFGNSAVSRQVKPEATISAGGETAPTAKNSSRSVDTVVISDEARALLENSLNQPGVEKEIPILKAEEKAKYNQDDLKGIKERFKKLKAAKNEINSHIEKTLKQNGLRLDSADKLKVELGSDGKVIVGGVSDAKTAKALEQALNQDKNFAKQLKSHREEERSVNAELKDVTGMSIQDYRQRQSEVMNDIEGINRTYNGIQGARHNADDMLAFKDQELYGVDPEFMEEIGDYLKAGGQFDTAPNHDILADPVNTMNKTTSEIRDKVVAQFAEWNRGLRAAKVEPGADPEEMFQRMKVTLDNVKIEIDAEGKVKIEGDISKDNEMNRAGKKFIEDLVKETFKYNPITGEKNDYQIAAERLMHLYEDEFGAPNADARAVSDINSGDVSSRIDSPSKVAELHEEIHDEVGKAVEQLGGQLDSQVKIEIGEDGLLTATNLPADDRNRQLLLDVLEQINTQLKIGGDEDAPENDNSISAIAGRIKKKLDHLEVFQEGGAGKIQKSYDYEKGEEHVN